ncbi:MAG: GIY-YIG nuclease family protein [Alphaproteobacteria bacterium]|nr:GIY-YIG nuclease family protein [Alphaproteobacteria bacterium]
MLEFNDCLIRLDIHPETVLIMRHRPPEPELRKRLPWLAAERHDVFNAYQQVQPKAERAMQRAAYVASFIGQVAGAATFVGLYEISGHRLLEAGELRSMSAYQELANLGVEISEAEQAGGHLLFDLQPAGFLEDFSGRMICKWPPPDRAWYRWADRNSLEISAIAETNRFIADLPKWDELVLSRTDLATLPPTWAAALSQWRGIYYVVDEVDGRGYVGCAYGEDNIYGRWREYARNGHGNNVGLLDRAEHDLLFSILQRVSPDMDPADVMALEASWKLRLHTRKLGLNRN